MDYPEQDDYLHNPDPRRDRKYDEAGNIFTGRGFTNLGCVIILVTGLLALLYVVRSHPLFHSLHSTPKLYSAGYPIIRHFSQHEQASFGGFNLGGINASGQVRPLPNSCAKISSNQIFNQIISALLMKPGSIHGGKLWPHRR